MNEKSSWNAKKTIFPLSTSSLSTWFYHIFKIAGSSLSLVTCARNVKRYFAILGIKIFLEVQGNWQKHRMCWGNAILFRGTAMIPVGEWKTYVICVGEMTAILWNNFVGESNSTPIKRSGLFLILLLYLTNPKRRNKAWYISSASCPLSNKNNNDKNNFDQSKKISSIASTSAVRLRA